MASDPSAMFDLDEDDRTSLLSALNDTYNKPGIVAAQTIFHGKRNESGTVAYRKLARLERLGLLRWSHRMGPYQPRADESVSQCYTLSERGREIAEALRDEQGGK